MVDNFILINQENFETTKIFSYTYSLYTLQVCGCEPTQCNGKENGVKQELITASIALVSTTVC